MPNRIPTPGIPTPAVRKSTAAQKPASYLGNVAKEVGDFGRAWKKAFNASADITPGANARARAANKNQDAQMGQVLGAVLQGRRYDSSGKQITGQTGQTGPLNKVKK